MKCRVRVDCISDDRTRKGKSLFTDTAKTGEDVRAIV